MSDMNLPPAGGSRRTGPAGLALDNVQAPGTGGGPRGTRFSFLSNLQRALHDDIGRLFELSDAQDRERIRDALLARLEMRYLADVHDQQHIDGLRAVLQERLARDAIRAEAAAGLLDPLLEESRALPRAAAVPAVPEAVEIQEISTAVPCTGDGAAPPAEQEQGIPAAVLVPEAAHADVLGVAAPEVNHAAALQAIERALALAFPRAIAEQQEEWAEEIVEEACRDPESREVEDDDLAIDTLDRLQQAQEALRDLVEGELREEAVETAIMEAFPELRGQRAPVIAQVIGQVLAALGDGGRLEPGDVTDEQFEELRGRFAQAPFRAAIEQQVDNAVAEQLVAAAGGSWPRFQDLLGDEVERRLPGVGWAAIHQAMMAGLNAVGEPTMKNAALAVLAAFRAQPAQDAPDLLPPEPEDRSPPPQTP